MLAFALLYIHFWLMLDSLSRLAKIGRCLILKWKMLPIWSSHLSHWGFTKAPGEMIPKDTIFFEIGLTQKKTDMLFVLTFELDFQNLRQYNTPTLRKWLSSNGCNTAGTKKNLIRRIKRKSDESLSKRVKHFPWNNETFFLRKLKHQKK